MVPYLSGKRVVLALDYVFGDSANCLVDLLNQSDLFVNYGSLAGAGHEMRLSQHDLFWKCITFKKNSDYMAVAPAMRLDWPVKARCLHREFTVIGPRFLRGGAGSEARGNQWKPWELGHPRSPSPRAGLVQH